MKLAFSNTVPKDWRDLQNQTARFLNQAGYHAVSPCEISTARGKVEVDVLVDSPDELVKRIICECKYWDSAVPKEKVHAFRTVVADSGASLGLLISKSGFQSGAIEAASYSNIQLITWDDFLSIVKDRWILQNLKELKRLSAPLSFYLNQLKFPFEKLKPDDKGEFRKLETKYLWLRWTCWKLSKTDLLNDIEEKDNWYEIQNCSSIEEYILFLQTEVAEALQAFRKIVNHSDIAMSESNYEDMPGFMFAFLE